MATGVAGAVLAVASLSGCGGQSDQAFCDSWTELDDSESLTLDELDEGLGTLEDNAPDDISEPVETLVTETEKIFAGLDDAGLDDVGDKTFEDLASDLSAEDQGKLAEAYGSVDQDAIDSAGDDVQSWVDDNCAA